MRFKNESKRNILLLKKLELIMKNEPINLLKMFPHTSLKKHQRPDNENVIRELMQVFQGLAARGCPLKCTF